MKTNRPIVLNEWADGGIFDMLFDFNLPMNQVKDVDIIFGSYVRYIDNDAFVLFKRNGEFYIVEVVNEELTNKWEPQLTTIEELRYRLERGELGLAHGNQFELELSVILDIESKSQ